MTVLYFALAALGFGFVIAIHEFGHFLFAKWAGVRVEVFSIGFGPRLFTRKIGDTEYSLSLLPLGGYVKMTGQEDLPEDPNAPPAPPDSASYLSASPGWKSAILLGGVLFNLISSYLIMVGLAVWGLPTLRPVVGEVQTEIIGSDGKPTPSPAAAMGLRPGDRILSLNGDKVRSFEELSTGAIIAGRKPLVMTIARPGVADPLTLPAEGTVTAAYDGSVGRPVLGLDPPAATRVVDVQRLVKDTKILPAIASSPRTGERVVSVAGTAVPADATGQEITERLAPWFGREVTLGLRDEHGNERTTTTKFAGKSGGIGCSLGLPVALAGVTPGSAAAEAGLRAGDVVATIDGVAVCGPEHFLALVRTAMAGSGRCAVEVRRDGTTIVAHLAGRDIAGRRRIGAMVETFSHGVLPLVAPAIDDKPSALAAAGVVAGDTLVAIEPGEALASTARVVSGGSPIHVPCSATAAGIARRGRTPGRLAKLIGDRGETALVEQLTAVQVVANADPAGAASGSPAPGLLQVRSAGGTPASVDLRPLGADGTALLAALQPGDWVLGLGSAGTWEVVRGATGAVRTLQVTARFATRPLAFTDIEMTPYQLEGPGEALAIANRATQTMIWRSLQFIPRFFASAENGGIDAKKSLQGPIGIFDELRLQAEHFGIASWLKLVALIGLNLVLVNLLPIPITDGGQLLFLAIETAIGRPVPPLVRTVAAWIGLGLVVGLMLYVTSLDILRRI